MTRDIEAWEDEGGAASESHGTPAAAQPVESKGGGRSRPRCEVIAIDRWKNDARKQSQGDAGG